MNMLRSAYLSVYCIYMDKLEAWKWTNLEHLHIYELLSKVDCPLSIAHLNLMHAVVQYVAHVSFLSVAPCSTQHMQDF